nr:PREDICTED: sortilin-related receptor [Lepisosteus oculatus]
MEYLFLRFAFLASCLTLHAGTTLRLADRIQGQCLTDTLKIKIAPEFLEAHNITLSAKDKNGVAHSLGSSLDAKCGYKQRRNSRGGLEVSASLMACHVYLKQQRQQQEARLVFTVGVSYAPRDGSGPGATESFSFSCPRRPGRARRRVLCEEDYIEVSLNIDVPFHHSMDKQARSQESPWYFTVQYPDGSIVTRDQAWIWNQGIGLNVEHFDGWIAFRVPQSSPLIIREDHQGYQSLGFKVVAKHEELLIGLRYDLSAVCPVVQVRCEGSNVSVSAANLRLPARGAPTEDLGLLLQLDGVSLSPQDAASRGYALQLGDSEIRASFAVRDNPLVPGGPSVMNRHQLSLVHMWRDGADQRNNKVVIHVPGHTCPSPPAQPAFSVTIRTEGFNITYGPVPGDYVLTSISLDGVLFQSVQDLPRGVGVRLVRRDRLLFVFVTARFGSRLLPRKYAGGFTSLYSTSPALLFKSPDLREVIAEEKETYTHLREDIVLPVLEGFCRNSSVCFNVTRGNADLFWSFYIWDTPFQAKRAAERGQSYASYRAHLTFCVDVRSPDLLHQGVSQDRRLLLLAVSFRDRAKGGVMATARQACPFRPAGELECTADGLLKATGLRLAASPLASLDRLTLRDPSCSPSEISDGKVSFSFPVYACGTLRKVHGTHVEYENRISNENALPKDAPEYLKFHCSLLCFLCRSTLVCRYSEENTLPVVNNEDDLGRRSGCSAVNIWCEGRRLWRDGPRPVPRPCALLQQGRGSPPASAAVSVRSPGQRCLEKESGGTVSPASLLPLSDSNRAVCVCVCARESVEAVNLLPAWVGQCLCVVPRSRGSESREGSQTAESEGRVSALRSSSGVRCGERGSWGARARVTLGGKTPPPALRIRTRDLCSALDGRAGGLAMRLLGGPSEPLRGRRRAVSLNDSHNLMVVHWAGEKSNVIVALARDSTGALEPKTSSVYVSYDYGASFQPISHKFQLTGDKAGRKQVIAKFYQSPADNKRYLFADTTNGYLWNTFDFCRTIQGILAPFRPTDLLLHSKMPNLVLGYDSTHPNKQLWKSDDFGETWVLIQEHVKAYFWGVEPYDASTTVFVQRHEPLHTSSVLSSTDFFQSEPNRRLILDRVDSFQLRDKYMFATRNVSLLGSQGPSSVQLWVSYNRQPMRAAQFMTRHPITEYYIADASEDQVFVCVNHNGSVTNLYISDAEGLSFSLSLENVLYYSPEGPGSGSLIRYFASEPFADIHRVEGLRGVYIATLTNGSLTEENMRSVITFDKGGTWELLQPPAADSLGGTLDCELAKGCSLHLSQRWSQLLNFQLPRMPILSKESAPGLILATVKYLLQEPELIRSSIPGHHATQGLALAGPHYYSWGDHGGILVAIAQGGPTTHLKPDRLTGFALLEQFAVLSWGTAAAVTLAAGGVCVPAPGSVGRNLANKPNVYVSSSAGASRGGERENLGGVAGGQAGRLRTPRGSSVSPCLSPGRATGVPCTESDYKLWSPSDERGNECLLGRKAVFKRRTAHATCFNGEDFDRPITVTNCSCTRQDYECDYGFKLSEDLSLEVCVPDPEFSGRLYAPPVPCPVGTTYRRTRGYRKIAGDTCGGGDVEARMDGEVLPCPVGESNEFLLYALRGSIHRYDLSSGTDETLPLSGLREAVALDFDYDRNCLYWADIALDTIQRLCLDGGSVQEVIVRKGLQNVEALAFDPVSRLLYWVDAGAQKMEVSNPDGDLRRTLLNSTVLEHPRALVLIPSERWLRRLGAANEIYWDDWSRMGIFRAPKTGSMNSEQLVGRLTGVMDLKIFYKGKTRGHNACADQPCSLLCLPQPGHRHTCVCPEGVVSANVTSGQQCQCPSGYHMQNHTCVKAEHSCLPSQYRCSNGNCISSIWQCDSDNDCGDMSDEQGCPTTSCDPDVQFRCVSSGSCIPLAFKCDHEDDCGDNSDENDCESHQCREDEFKCARGVCIHATWRCDGDNDCRDWSDEANCTTGHHTCEADSFQCRTGHCIPQRWVCDGDDDCQDGSCCLSPCLSCAAGDHCKGFKCSNGTCLPATRHCDGREDCPGGADEQNCEPLCTRYMDFVCRSRRQCLFQSMVCDGVRHCEDGSDEDAGYAGCCESPPSRPRSCSLAGSSRGSPAWVCVLRGQARSAEVKGQALTSGRCRLVAPAGSDVWPQRTTPAGPASCPPNRFRCTSGACIVDSWVCDRYADCPDGSDEEDCPAGECLGVTKGHTLRGQRGARYTVKPEHSLLPTARSRITGAGDPRQAGRKGLTSGFPGVKGPSSGFAAHWVGLGCPTRGALTCVNGTLCADGEACVSPSERCDGFIDCSDQSDEANCSADSLAYKVQNLRWTADFSGTVTLTWSRPKNLPLNSCTFVVYYRQVGSQWSTVETHTSKSSYSLTLLKPDTTYQVKVQVQCLSKLHKSNEVVTLRTPEGLPDAPQNLELSSSEEEDGTVICKWLPPANSHGLIREYIVEYSESASGQWTSQRSSSLGNDHTEIKSLQPDLLYNVRVAAVTSRGVGNWSDVKSVTPQKGKALPAPTVRLDGTTESSFTVTLGLGAQYQVKRFVVDVSWLFDAHVKENRTVFVEGTSPTHTVGNLTAGTMYEVAAWAQTSVGDSPTSFSHLQTHGTRPDPPQLKARPLNQSSVDCSWSGPEAQLYGLYYATSFLELYRGPHRLTTSGTNLTVTVDGDEQYLFLVRVVSPYLGPPSDYAVVKMIPSNRLPPRNLHRVRVDKTQATLKWQPPCDYPSEALTYAIHLRDTVRKAERSFKVKTANNTVEYTLRSLEPGGRYSVTVRLANMSKEASYTFSTVPLPAPDALKILSENDHIFLFWKSLALKDKIFDENRGYEVHVYDSVTNSSTCLGNTTENFLRISSLLAGHNYTFSVQARCLLNGQLCGEPALLLYDELAAGEGSPAASQAGRTGDVAAVVVPVLFLLLLALGGGFVVLYVRHRRLQHSFTAFANSHYNSRLGSAIFSSGDELGDDDEDAPMISGFSDDVPMVIA